MTKLCHLLNIKKEIKALKQVLNQSHRTVAEEFGLTVKNAPTNPAFLTEEMILRSIENKHIDYYGLYQDNALIGCYALEINPNQDHSAYLERVSVTPEYRHQGFGEIILKDSEIKSRLKNIQTIKIGIIHENIRLKNWYRRSGYKETGTKQFPHLPFTVSFMEKTLSEPGTL